MLMAIWARPVDGIMIFWRRRFSYGLGRLKSAKSMAPLLDQRCADGVFFLLMARKLSASTMQELVASLRGLLSSDCRHRRDDCTGIALSAFNYSTIRSLARAGLFLPRRISPLRWACWRFVGQPGSAGAENILMALAMCDDLPAPSLLSLFIPAIFLSSRWAWRRSRLPCWRCFEPVRRRSGQGYILFWSGQCWRTAVLRVRRSRIC